MVRHLDSTAFTLVVHAASRLRLVVALLFLLAPMHPRFAYADDATKERKNVVTQVDDALPRIWVRAEFNGVPARLLLDTGASRSVLFRGSAARLGLKLLKSTTGSEDGAHLDDGRVTVTHRTEHCAVRLGEWTFTDVSWPVLTVAQPLEHHAVGILGWDSVRHGVVEIDWDKRSVWFRKNVPAHCAGWRTWSMRKKAPTLIVEYAGTRGEVLGLLVDTGDERGVGLAKKHWHEWTNRRDSAPTSLSGIYSPGQGFVAQPIQWAEELRFGDLEFNGMPVCLETHPILDTWRCAAQIGLLGLSRFNLVIDGQSGLIYLNPRKRFAWKFTYNRLGAVFIPRDLESTALIAHVVPGTPAALAGIERGDELLRIDDLDVTVWRTDPRVLPLARFWGRAAGTDLVLTVARGSKQIKIPVRLKELFPHSGRYDP